MNNLDAQAVTCFSRVKSCTVLQIISHHRLYSAKLGNALYKINSLTRRPLYQDDAARQKINAANVITKTGNWILVDPKLKDVYNKVRLNLETHFLSKSPYA